MVVLEGESDVVEVNTLLVVEHQESPVQPEEELGGLLEQLASGDNGEVILLGVIGGKQLLAGLLSYACWDNAAWQHVACELDGRPASVHAYTAAWCAADLHTVDVCGEGGGSLFLEEKSLGHFQQHL